MLVRINMAPNCPQLATISTGSVELKGLLSRGIEIVIVIRNPVQVRLAEES